MAAPVHRLLSRAGMEEEKPPFRFLSEAEFLALGADERVAYLVRASDEIDLRQREFREQVKRLIPEARGGE